VHAKSSATDLLSFDREIFAASCRRNGGMSMACTACHPGCRRLPCTHSLVLLRALLQQRRERSFRSRHALGIALKEFGEAQEGRQLLDIRGALSSKPASICDCRGPIPSALTPRNRLLTT
jgi:hypothetical protein